MAGGIHGPHVRTPGRAVRYREEVHRALAGETKEALVVGPSAPVRAAAKGYTHIMQVSPRRALSILLAASLFLGSAPPTVQAQVVRVAAGRTGGMPVSPVIGSVSEAIMAPALGIGAASLNGSLGAPSISPSPTATAVAPVSPSALAVSARSAVSSDSSLRPDAPKAAASAAKKTWGQRFSSMIGRKTVPTAVAVPSAEAAKAGADLAFDGAVEQTGSVEGPAVTAFRSDSLQASLSAAVPARKTRASDYRLEGRLDIASYRASATARFKMAALRTGVVAFGALFLALPMIEAAWAGAVIAGLFVWKSYLGSNSRDLPSHSPSRLSEDDVRAYRGQLQEILGELVLRMGLPAHRIPRLYVTAGSNAQAYGKRVDAIASIGVGSMLRSAPTEEIASTLAHELGHLHSSDSNTFRIVLMTALLGPVIALIALNVPGLQSLVLYGGLPGAYASLLAYLGMSRQEELRADMFSAWLTDPRWQLEKFDRLKKETDAQFSERGVGRFRRRLFWLMSTHPSYDARIRQMQRLIRRGN